MNIRTRLTKIEMALTPKQIALKWLADARRYTLTEYRQSLGTDQPRLREGVMDAVEKAVRAAMKHADVTTADRALRQTLADADFLMCLALEANEAVVWTVDLPTIALFVSELTDLGERAAVIADMHAQFWFLSAEPYPVDLDTSAAYTWVRQGWIHGPDDCRADVDSWTRQHFAHGERVSTTEFEATRASVQAAFDALVAEGALPVGRAVDLELPLDAPPRVPLFDGEWIDRWLVELAEWHAALIALGFVDLRSDPHALAWPEYRRPGASSDEEGAVVTQQELADVRLSVRERLTAFPGRTREHAGRVFLACDDYQNWDGRAAQPLTEVTGVTPASWNAWIAANGGVDAQLAGVRVAPFDVLLRDDFIVVVDDEKRLTQQTTRRHHFDRIRSWLVELGPTRDRPALTGSAAFVARRAALGSDVLAHGVALFQLKAAIDRLQTRFFEGLPILFQDIHQNLDRAIEQLGRVVALFNRVAAVASRGETLSLDDVERLADAGVASLVEGMTNAARRRTLQALAAL
jgi:hypothetical protein